MIRVIESLKESTNNILERDDKFRYQFLGRLIADCKHYLGNGNRNVKYLWADDEKEQIQMMKDLWNSFNEEDKPTWTSYEEIINFEKEMLPEVTEDLNEDKSLK